MIRQDLLLFWCLLNFAACSVAGPSTHRHTTALHAIGGLQVEAVALDFLLGTDLPRSWKGVGEGQDSSSVRPSVRHMKGAERIVVPLSRHRGMEVITVCQGFGAMPNGRVSPPVIRRHDNLLSTTEQSKPALGAPEIVDGIAHIPWALSSMERD